MQMQRLSAFETTVTLLRQVVVDARCELTPMELLLIASDARERPPTGTWPSKVAEETITATNESTLQHAVSVLKIVDADAKALLVELLSKQYFAKAIALLKEREVKKDAEVRERRKYYEEVTALHHAPIGRIFNAMDDNGNGFLEMDELRDTLAEYMGIEGKQFDVEGFMKFYDAHGTPDGKINPREWRWFLADWADCFVDSSEEGDVAAARLALEDIIADFEALVSIRKHA